MEEYLFVEIARTMWEQANPGKDWDKIRRSVRGNLKMAAGKLVRRMGFSTEETMTSARKIVDGARP